MRRPSASAVCWIPPWPGSSTVISAVVVSYRSATLAVRAIASLRADAARAELSCEVVAVVNSGDPDEAATLGEAADRVVIPASNLGYAGGLNAGVAAARGEVLFLANPDLVFLEGSAGALAEAVRGAGPVVAGPALFWDDAASLILPPAEEPRPAELVRRVLALDPLRSPRLFRREVRRALDREAFVRERRTAKVTALSGALLATTRDTFEQVGPFDEGYRLYYEENDWQRRVRAAGGRLLFAGGARVVHRYAQSARREPRAEAWFHESERRYFEAHFGEAGRRALAWTATAGAPPADPPTESRLRWEGRQEALVAVSPAASFRPFALVRPARGTGSFALPSEILSGHPDAAWYARAFDASSFETLAEARLSPA